MTSTDDTALTAAWSDFRDQLDESGVLKRTGADGLYGRSGDYERVAAALRRRIASQARAMYGREVPSYTFAPVYPLASYEKTDYIASFPNLAGGIFSFYGGDKEHRALLADRAEGLPWDGHLAPSGMMLVPAACHPSYEQYAGMSVGDGVVYTLESWCFRHEPSVDPMRMQAFRMLEFVFIGTPAAAYEHRETWVAAGLKVLTGLGLEVDDVPANDPFFGRAGRMLAVNQREESLKTEIVTRVYGELGEGTAIASGNYHLDHFGAPYEITAGSGETAHSACFGFGVDRITLALLKKHGLDLAMWPEEFSAILEEPLA